MKFGEMVGSGILTRLRLFDEYSEYYLVEIAVEEDRELFIASPPLSMLDAAYGLSSVTKKAMEIAHYNSFEASASDDIFGNGWPGVA